LLGFGETEVRQALQAVARLAAEEIQLSGFELQHSWNPPLRSVFGLRRPAIVPCDCPGRARAWAPPLSRYTCRRPAPAQTEQWAIPYAAEARRRIGASTDVVCSGETHRVVRRTSVSQDLQHFLEFHAHLADDLVRDRRFHARLLALEPLA